MCLALFLTTQSGPVYTGPDKNLHVSTMPLRGTGGTGRICASVQVWDLKKAGQLFHRHGSILHTDSCKHPNLATFSQIARLRPGIWLCYAWFLSKNETFGYILFLVCYILLNLRQKKQTKADYRFEETSGRSTHRYFSRISRAFAVHFAVNGYCFRYSSIKANYTFEFLGEHVQLTKQPTEGKVLDYNYM